MLSNEPIRYSILDPSGNITALVESAVGADARAAVAAELMRRHPEVEQVGFVRRTEPGDPVRAELNMAGGEFCGNASLCTAALLLLDGDAPVGPDEFHLNDLLQILLCRHSVLFIDGGVVVEEGAPESIFRNTQNPRTRQFLESYNK